MDDQTFNALGAVMAGLSHQQRERIIGILENPPAGRTSADLVQLLDFKKIIDELTRLVEAYQGRGWKDIDGDNPQQVNEFREHYLKLHFQIVDYFGRIQYGNFSRGKLDNYDSIQGRILSEEELTKKRRTIQGMWDFYHEVSTLPDKIRKLPYFNLQKVEQEKAAIVRKTGQSGEVTEYAIKTILSEGNDTNPEYLHLKWFVAKLFIKQQPARIEKATIDVDNFEKSFKKATSQERQALTAFKRNQDPKYCTMNYQIAYNDWCLNRFRNLLGRES